MINENIAEKIRELEKDTETPQIKKMKEYCKLLEIDISLSEIKEYY